MTAKVPGERWLNLDLDDSTGAPLAERPFTIDWHDGAEPTAGSTDAQGHISLLVPAGARRASLVVLYRKLELELDVLPDLQTVEGVQERLNHMNYFSGRVDGDHGPRTRNAVESFQRAHQLTPTGQADPDTIAQVAAEYGDRE